MIQFIQTRDIQYTARIIFILSISVEVFGIVSAIQTDNYYIISIIPLLVGLSIFFVNSTIVNIVGIIIPRGWLKGNSLYFTDTCIPDIPNISYPSLTIQIPVYKECFSRIIKPTILQAIEACKEYSLMTGASANVFVNDDGLALISPEQRKYRICFYVGNQIEYSERPASGRRGKFKKAGNMNYALNRHTVGDIILLLDSDSRIPTKGLASAVREFIEDASLGFLQMKTVAMYTKSSLWESMVSHFTNTIYNISFHTTCAYGDPSPLVGHNVFLRKSALEACAYSEMNPLSKNQIQDIVVPFSNDTKGMTVSDMGVVQKTIDVLLSGDDIVSEDPIQNIHSRIYTYFSEDHVSEDFELSMRLQAGGYVGRYGTFLEGFEEGVTLTALDEIIRLQKYAYGVSELMMHPVYRWCSRGILCETFKKYLLSNCVPLSAKYNVLGYIGTYYALAIAPLFVTVNYFCFSYISYWRQISISSMDIIISCAVVFVVLTPISVIFVRKKLRQNALLLRELRSCILFCLFFSGIGFHLFIAIASHMCGINISWSTTNKESTSKMTKIKSLGSIWHVYLLSVCQILLIVFGWIYLEIRSLPAIVPLLICAVSHILVPVLGIF